MRTRITLAGVAGLVLALVLASCGTKREVTSPGQSSRQPLRLMLDYLPNVDHAPIYVARARGEFARAGLDVSLATPPDPSAPLKLLAAGKTDLAISYQPELLLARDRGLRLVSVAALVQRPLTSIMAIGGSPVRAPADLAGHTVGTAGIPYQTAQLRTILRGAGRPADSAREINVGFNLVPAMLSRKVDATLGAFWNVEGVQLAREGKRPLVVPVDRAGVPTYNELVIVARQGELADRGNVVRRFLAALARGAELTRRDPAGAVNDLVRANPGLDRRIQLAQLRATLPAFAPPAGKPFGYQDEARWAAFGRWMLDNGLVRRDPNAGDALTNEFLAGQGV